MAEPPSDKRAWGSEYPVVRRGWIGAALTNAGYHIHSLVTYDGMCKVPGQRTYLPHYTMNPNLFSEGLKSACKTTPASRCEFESI